MLEDEQSFKNGGGLLSQVLKVPMPHFDLELHMLVVLCSMLKLEDFSSENYLKTLVIKVSKTYFSKLRVRKKNPIQSQFFFAPP
jgi:hypothetical protein